MHNPPSQDMRSDKACSALAVGWPTLCSPLFWLDSGGELGPRDECDPFFAQLAYPGFWRASYLHSGDERRPMAVGAC
ncbi:uncharacterized protein PgNI_04606 [Pyricularia grisea]|uniref:Uncharacterized protein n=1 Tax=Pyricularia grisea TaxID=148305 RepID=A0A6P8BAG6_PYRGI|nr:uncharacterized protein PgNI_04606 [Pyricularia grisea]TLD12815.1 hypothetical protein PgNI_04606 [Pyricularia grisea]